jgi:EAL domain-containing protein (putative c-di-GMP-specific phosphodiesterase class I)/CheY-like chemotaxis protein
MDATGHPDAGREIPTRNGIERSEGRAKLCGVVDAIRVIIAEDDPALRAVLAKLIGDEHRLELVGAAGDADEAIELAQAARPDVALVDVRMPGGGGPRVAVELGLSSPNTKVVALSAVDDRSSVLDMLQSGAVGYLVKGASGQEIVEAVCRSVRGLSSLSPQVTGDVIRELVGQLELRDHEAQVKRRRAEVVRDLLRAGTIGMAFQPIVHLRVGTTVGVEALARFPHKTTRSPDRWFAEAAEIGLRLELELASARAALSHLERVPEPMYLSINLSPDTLVSPEFMHMVADTPLHRVVVELSEQIPVSDYDQLNQALGQLRARGGRLAIDDAGAGFASLQHILRLSPDIIKLDMTLTKGVDSDQARRALAFALTSFASEIGADIVAEGVETSSEVDALRQLGVTYGQGFYLGYPGWSPWTESAPGASSEVADAASDPELPLG